MYTVIAFPKDFTSELMLMGVHADNWAEVDALITGAHEEDLTVVVLNEAKRVVYIDEDASKCMQALVARLKAQCAISKAKAH